MNSLVSSSPAASSSGALTCGAKWIGLSACARARSSFRSTLKETCTSGSRSKTPLTATAPAMVGGNDEIALVLAVFLVDKDGELARLQLGNDFVDRADLSLLRSGPRLDRTQV